MLQHFDFEFELGAAMGAEQGRPVPRINTKLLKASGDFCKKRISEQR